MFEPKKYTELFDALRSRIPPALTDFETGSVTRTLAESFAFEMGLLYEKMHKVYLSAFVDTAEGTQLDQVVSILGVKRGLPDFSSGTVVFLRDIGNEDIAVPVGTLVATEDLPEMPKKMYQTIESVTLTKNQGEAEAKVQAIQQGEDQDANAETITVMPRPIPGIKSVINRNPVKLTGKRRETDDELRERAKNSLLASGKATILSIENAVLSMPGVLDVRVKERFRFAEGEITVKNNGSPDSKLPKGTLLSIGAGPSIRRYRTRDDLQFRAGQDTGFVGIVALLEGKMGEAQNGETLAFEENGFPSILVTLEKPVLLGSFGVVEVYVDIKNFEKIEVQTAIEREIERVKAAGIMAILKPVTEVRTKVVLRIEPVTQANLSVANLEGKVGSDLEVFFQELRMGQPLLFSKLVKRVLSIEGVDNLADFNLTTFRKVNDSADRVTLYKFSDNKILIDEFESLKATEICVAAEDKTLPVSMEFRASGIVDQGRESAVATALTSFFSGKQPGDMIKRSEVAAILTSLNPTGLGFDESSLKIKAQSWCEREVLSSLGTDDIVVNATFVEKPVLGNVFYYNNSLLLTGAMRLILPLNLTQQEKAEVTIAAKTSLASFLDNLKAEEDLVFENLRAAMMQVEKVLDVEIDKADFRVTLEDGTAAPERLDAKKVDVRKFEKLKDKDFAVVADTSTVKVEVTNLEINILTPQPNNSSIDTLKNMVANAINTFLVAATPGDDLIYNNLRNAVQNLLPELSYSITALRVKAISSADGREQNANTVAPNEIHVRSVELATMQVFAASSIVINIETP